MQRGNCWLYALPRWLKSPRDRYLVVRLSRRGIWPHVFLAKSIDNLLVEEFIPAKPMRGVVGFFHAILFRGYVRRGFGEKHKD